MIIYDGTVDNNLVQQVVTMFGTEASNNLFK